MPENIGTAVDGLKTINLIPALGESSVVTVAAVPSDPPPSPKCGGDPPKLLEDPPKPPPRASAGLNVHSMLKHETLVLTLDTVTFLEKKLLWHDTRYTALYPFSMPYSDFP